MRAVEQTYQAIVETLDDSIAVKDAELRYVMANSAFLSSLGVRLDDVVGKSAADLYPEAVAAERTRLDLEALRRRVPVEDEVQGLLPSGENDGRTYLNRRVPIKSDDGRVVGLVVTARDITDRKRAELGFQKAEEKYRSIVENAGDSIVVVQDGKVVYRNKADIEILGKTVDETAKQSFLDFVAPEDRDRIVGVLRGPTCRAAGARRV